MCQGKGATVFDFHLLDYIIIFFWLDVMSLLLGRALVVTVFKRYPLCIFIIAYFIQQLLPSQTK
jgi:hypothetical protein